MADYSLVPGNQGSFQMFILSPLPIRHINPSAINARALHRLLQVNKRWIEVCLVKMDVCFKYGWLDQQ
ncbi:hypothetical protein V6Z12_A10G140900 [Gossypium hirsutum]